MDSFHNALAFAQIGSFLLLLVLCVGSACFGMYGLAIVWAFIGTMMVEPWHFRWPENDCG